MPADTPRLQMRALAASDAFNRVFTLQTPYVDSSYRRRQDRRQIPTITMLGLKHGPPCATLCSPTAASMSS